MTSVSKKIVVSGATGLIGSALVPFLAAAGHDVACLVHRTPSQTPGVTAIPWDPQTEKLERAALDGTDVVIHLAGDNIASGRWTEEKKRRIRNTRVVSTRLLSQTLASLSRPPEVFLSGSAVGYYGDRGDTVLTEESGGGRGFLAGVCREWEAATQAARSKGIRTITLRTGMVLSGAGGILSKLERPFKFGLGGPIGDGRQYMSWIAIDDFLAAVLHLISIPTLQGPVNMVSPTPVTNTQFTETLARILSRPAKLRLPAKVVQWVWGEMGRELFLASTRARPERLIATQFQFSYPTLDAALRHVLGR